MASEIIAAVALLVCMMIAAGFKSYYKHLIHVERGASSGSWQSSLWAIIGGSSTSDRNLFSTTIREFSLDEKIRSHKRKYRIASAALLLCWALFLLYFIFVVPK